MVRTNEIHWLLYESVVKGCGFILLITSTVKYNAINEVNMHNKHSKTIIEFPGMLRLHRQKKWY